jgi:predicted TIM-barrel fold metal-dependent hydrolase
LTLESLARSRSTASTALPARAAFASDAPVAGLHATYDEVWDSFKAITADFAAAEQAAMFHGNAWRLYRFDDVSRDG